MSTEKSYKPLSGYTMLGILLVLGIVGLVLLASRQAIGGIMLFLLLPLLGGFFFLNPNSSVVLVLFGDYKGTVKDNGFHWVNPFFAKKKISLRARNFDSEKIKVNDKVGNPIQIGVILVWQVRDTFKAAFDVDNYETFVRVQSDAAVRTLAGLY
ncbi:MAG TPA: SPFH domain-containing protein, partial [Cyclobacteriaceae bacterium]|nr:SPFH domain-containing protein [Cyclobacteriaceae bacterium]